MRLIDADALIDEVMERYCEDCSKRKGLKNGKWRIVYSVGDVPCRACGIGDMMDEIDSAPTVDAVPVVRCKDCRYGYHFYDVQNGITDSWVECRNPNGLNRDVPEDGYCYCVERRSDDRSDL